MSASTPENGTSTAATTPRISMLPSGTRLASGAPPQLAESGAAAAPTLAPSTAAIASVGVTAPVSASVAMTRTTASEECAAQVMPAARIAASTGSLPSAASTRPKVSDSANGTTVSRSV